MDGEYYIRSLGMEISLRDVKLYIRYYRSKIKLLTLANLIISVFILLFGLSTERVLIKVCCVFFTLFNLLQLVSQYLTIRRSMILVTSSVDGNVQYSVSLFCGLLTEIIVLLYCQSIVLYGIHPFIIIVNCLNMIAAFLTVALLPSNERQGIISYYEARIQTCLHYIPQECKKRTVSFYRRSRQDAVEYCTFGCLFHHISCWGGILFGRMNVSSVADTGTGFTWFFIVSQTTEV